MKKIKKFLLTGVLALATVFASVGGVLASAEEHSHTYTNDRCTCGSARFEGENADMSKAVSADHGGMGTLVEDVVKESGGSATASGGKSFGNWSVAGNTVEWRFSIDKESSAVLTLAMASCGGATTMTETHELTVNGVKATWADESVPALSGQQYWDFKEYKTNAVTFPAGEITVVLKNVNGFASNIDYLDIAFGADITIGEAAHKCVSVCPTCGGCYDYDCAETVCTTKCSCVTHLHTFNAENRCECGALKLEAESASIAGTPTNEKDTFFLSEAEANASGNAYVGNWGGTDNVMTFMINVSKAQDVQLGITFAPCKPGASWVLPTAGTRDDKGATLWPFEVRVNNTWDSSNEVALFEQAQIPAGDGASYYNWYTVYTKPVHLKAGDNMIQIEAWDHYEANFDYITVGITPDTTYTIPEVVDVIKPTAKLEVVSAELSVGKEVEFSVTVSDNVSKPENITVETKVYLNYNRDSEQEIACANNKFLPAEEGRYTIVVKATDEAGNSVEETRAISISSDEVPGPEASTPDEDASAPSEDPDEGKDEGFLGAIGNWEPIAGWPLKVFAWETAIPAGLLVLVLFVVIYLIKSLLRGKFRLTKQEKEYVKTAPKTLKKMKAAERKAELSKQSKRVRKTLKWRMSGRKVLISVGAIVMALVMVAAPVLTTTMPYIMEALFPTNVLKPDSESAKLAIGEAKENVVKIEEEGITLLKNNEEDGAPVLPLDVTKDTKVNLFGSSVFGMLYGGGGSGVFVTNATSYGNELYATRLEDALETEGFEYNKNLYNLVANYFESKTYKITETDYDIQCQNNVFGGNTKDDQGNILIDETRFPYDNEPEASAYTKTYDGLNGQTLLEEAKDYSDIAIYAVSRAGSEDGDLTYNNTLLTSREVAMINLLKENFKRVIVLINSSNTMELGALDDEGIDSVLWIGHPGLTGNTAVAGVISGRLNPSGRLVDTWAYSGKDNPASLMFGHEGTVTYSNYSNPYQVYYEGVYLGYRYFATRGMTDDSYDYDEHVQWSFGEGMSYTTFEKKITEFEVDEENDKISLQVEVTNTGDVKGKEVVQVYFNAPYTGKVEKPYYELAGFKKTDVIEPGESFFARVEFAISDMASWDSSYNGGAGAYLLEAGDYNISVRDNVWDIAPDADTEDEFVNEHVYTLGADKAITTDTKTGNAVATRFADVEYGPNDSKVIYLSRSDWAGTYPTADKINRVASSAVKNTNWVKSYKDNQITQKDTSEWTQGEGYGLTVRDFKDKGINDTIELYGETYTWDDLINQMTIEDMCKLVDSQFMGTVAIDSVGKRQQGDDDGPASVSIYGVGYPSEVVVASTWEPQMGYLLGASLGKEGAAMGMTGWYAPGVNLHRAAPGGRNFEYYSEDPLISGLMCAETVKGAAKFGIYTYIKHFALNDQETERRTIQVWANEQSMRELYLRAFEIAIKEGGSIGIMSSFNFLGTTWAGGSKALMNDVLRTEWGFEGVAVTDWTNPSTMPVSAGLRAGNDLWLGANVTYGAMKAYNETPDDVHYLLRQACKRILYATANSNGVWSTEDYKAAGIQDPPAGAHDPLGGYH